MPEGNRLILALYAYVHVLQARCAAGENFFLHWKSSLKCKIYCVGYIYVSSERPQTRNVVTLNYKNVVLNSKCTSTVLEYICFEA